MGVGLGVDFDDFQDVGVGFDPAVGGEVSQDVGAVGGDGEVAGEEGVGGCVFERERGGEFGGLALIAFEHVAGGGVVPPEPEGLAGELRVEGAEGFAGVGIDEGGAEETGAIDAEAVFATPDVARAGVALECGDVGLAVGGGVWGAVGEEEEEGQKRGRGEREPAEAFSGPEDQDEAGEDSGGGEEDGGAVELGADGVEDQEGPEEEEAQGEAEGGFAEALHRIASSLFGEELQK